MPYTDLTQKIKRRVEKLPYVEAFYIHGSRAVGRNSPTSDIDYMFLLKNHKTDDDKLINALRDLIEFKPMPGWYPEQTWIVASRNDKKLKFNDIGFHTATTKEILNRFSKLFKSKDYLLKNQDNAQFLIAEAKAVYDPRGYVKKLKKLISKYPKKLSDEIVQDMVQKLKVKLMWVDPWIPRNKYSFINDVRDIVWFIAVAHYAKNRAFLMNSMKRWHQDMKSFKPSLKGDLDKLLSIDSGFSKVNKAKYLKRIIKKFEEDHGS